MEPNVILLIGVLTALVASVFLCVCQARKKKRSISIANEDGKSVRRYDGHAIQEEAVLSPGGNDSVPLANPDDEHINAHKKKGASQGRKLPAIPYGDDVDGSRLQPLDAGYQLYEMLDNERLNAHHPLISTMEDTGGPSGSQSHITEVARPESSSKPPTPSSRLRNENNGIVLDGPELLLPSAVDDAHSFSSDVQGQSKVKGSHNYARITGQASEDRDTDTDNYDDPHKIWDYSSASIYEPPPPVPEKCFNAAESHPLYPVATSAATAVAGEALMRDIPYMTSPPGTPQTGQIYTAESIESGGSRQEIRYTSISVREPLENIRAHSSTVDTSVTRGSSNDPESIYSIVPEDADQMYAEIESAQNSGNSSMTYARIEPQSIRERPRSSRPGTMLMADDRPEPPTIDSLRSVAQAHSRHASMSSAASNMTSSPLEHGDGATFHGASPQDLSSMYSKVDKSKKNRHVVNVDESSSASHSVVDDIYAKVVKTKLHTQGLGASHPAHGSFSPGPVRPLSALGWVEWADRSSTNYGMHKTLGRHESNKLDPGYEKIKNRSASTNDLETAASNSTGSSSTVGYESVKPRGTMEENAPNYETIGRHRSDPGYEKINSTVPFSDYHKPQYNRTDSNEPGYETVKGDRLSDVESGGNGYERVKGGGSSRQSPSYESVRYSGMPPDLSRSSPESSDHGYWKIPDEDGGDHLYERINTQDDGEEPNYARINYNTLKSHNYDTDEGEGEPGYEKVRPRSRLKEFELHIQQKESNSQPQSPSVMEISNLPRAAGWDFISAGQMVRSRSPERSLELPNFSSTEQSEPARAGHPDVKIQQILDEENRNVPVGEKQVIIVTKEETRTETTRVIGRHGEEIMRRVLSETRTSSMSDIRTCGSLENVGPLLGGTESAFEGNNLSSEQTDDNIPTNGYMV